MAMAPVVYTLWQDYLRFDPKDPIWPNRDRFILSAGHASTLLYALLHLAGVKAVNRKYETLGEIAVSVEDLKKFRQLESKCPGHPEYRWTSGVETTTGPLGQGVATSAGIALAGKWLAERYNRPNFTLFDYNVYALAGDGCMMEGISSEAPRWRVICDCRICVGSMTTTTSPSRETPVWLSLRMWRDVFWLMDGMSNVCLTPMTLISCGRLSIILKRRQTNRR